MKKVKFFFTPFSASTYGKYVICNFVFFRIKSACRANYGGATFLFRQKVNLAIDYFLFTIDYYFPSWFFAPSWLIAYLIKTKRAPR